MLTDYVNMEQMKNAIKWKRGDVRFVTYEKYFDLIKTTVILKYIRFHAHQAFQIQCVQRRTEGA